VILDLEGRKVMGLNAVGSWVWTALDGKTSLGVVAEGVSARFGVPPERARADVVAFATQLVRRGLLEVRAVP
jgi:hypothetical protein